MVAYYVPSYLLYYFKGAISKLFVLCILELQVPKKTTKKTITKEDLQKTVDILLTETETMTLFNLPTVMISVEAEEAENILYVWFKCLHCFYNLNAKTEFLIFFKKCFY